VQLGAGLNHVFDQCDLKACEVWFHCDSHSQSSFTCMSCQQQHTTSIMMHVTEDGLNMTPMGCFMEERDESPHDPHCTQLSNLGLVKHVTKMGMTPEQLKGRIPECGNCSGCQ